MNWLLLTLLAVTSRATYSIATKILSHDVKVSPITQSLLLTAFAGLLSLALSPLIGGLSFTGLNHFLVPVILVICAQAVGNILYFKGMKNLDASTAQIAFSSILLWGTILSVIFLNSIFSPLQLIGIVLLLIAILLVQYNKGKIIFNRSFFYIVASAVFFAVFQVASADLSKSLSIGTYLVLANLGPSLIIGVMYFNIIKKDFLLLKSQVKKTFAKTFFASGTSLLYFFFSYLAYTYAPSRGIVVVLLTTQVVLSVLFGIFFLKEKENKVRKLSAGVLAFLAGVLIKS
ncbi:MAG: EamA family transporter [Patescibacteria group bacterium]